MSTFISYSRADSAFAVRLAKDLKSAGYDVWLDQLDIPTGTRWDDEVETALEACSTFMVVLSPESLQSQNVKDEIGYAIDSSKDILPVKIKTGDIPFRLRRFQYVDFSNQPYQDSLKEIKNILSASGQLYPGREADKRPPGADNEPTLQKVSAVKAAAVTQPKITAIHPQTSAGSGRTQPPLTRRLMIGLAAIGLLVVAGVLIRTFTGTSAGKVAAPSAAPAIENQPTERPTARPTMATDQAVVPSTAEQPASLLTKFASSNDLDGWEPFILGKKDKVTVPPPTDGLLVSLGAADLRAYYFYQPVIYRDVVVRLRAENLGQNTNLVGLVCRKTENQWYEFSIEAASIWKLFEYRGQHNLLDGGGTMAGMSGRETNEYEMHCLGNEISLYVNGQPVAAYDVKKNAYLEGQVGFNISSSAVYPINMRVVEFEALSASEGSITAASTPASSSAGVTATP